MQLVIADHLTVNNHTYPAPDPKEAIDYIAVSKQNATGFAVISAKVVNELMASDHRPILVELRTAEKADKIFRTKPYLQNPVGNGITVMWETTVPSYCWVEAIGSLTTLADMTANPVAFCFDAAI